jgi:hypothetical protein
MLDKQMARIALLLALGLVAVKSQAQSSAPIDPFTVGGPLSFVFPRGSVSQQDQVHVLVGTYCGRLQLDPTRPPEVRRIPSAVPQFYTATLQVDVYLRPAQGAVCFAAPVPWDVHNVPLGTLEKGVVRVSRRLFVRPTATAPHELRAEAGVDLRVLDAPHASASGAWFDPAQPGTGLFLNLMGAESDAAVYLTERAVGGELNWWVGVGRFQSGRLELDLARGGSSEPGALRRFVFEYRGCGRAESAFGTGAQPRPLVQLTQVQGIEGCEPPRLQYGFVSFPPAS